MAVLLSDSHQIRCMLVSMKPQYLYKYISLRTKYARGILTDNQLYFSRRADFNDPFDCLTFFDFSGGSKEEQRALYDSIINRFVHEDEHFSESIIDELTRKYQRTYPTLDEAGNIAFHNDLYIQANLDDLGVLCLSATGTDPVMFNHYCNNHTGVCVQFAVDDRSFFARAEEVSYQQTYPVLDYFGGKTQKEEERLLYLYKTERPQYGKEYRQMYLTKYEGWQYEREWRVLDFVKGYGLHYYPAGLMTAVTFGINTSEQDKARVKSWLRRRGHPVKLFQARQEPGKFQLKLVDEVGP